jgi:hypothetical protein
MIWRRKKSTTTVVATTTTTVAPTTTTIVSSTMPLVSSGSGPLRGSMLGISAGSFASIAVLDAIVELGLGWVRVSHEYGWPNTIQQLAATVVEAHKRDLRVIQSVQISGHRYDDPTATAGLTQFAIDCVRAGVDCLEIGNEWNHAPFWQGPDVNVMPPVAQARLSTTIALAVRNVFPTATIITNGVSPEADPLNPWTWLSQFWSADLTNHQNAKWSGVGVHPYCYPELATTNPAQWNPFAQVPTILADAKSKRIVASVWLTELGAPGFATNAPIIRGVALTEQRQVDCYAAYVQMIRNHEAQGIRYPAICFTTMFDGQSATTSVETGLGLRRSDGSRKPVWDLVRSFALEGLPA